LVVSGGGLACSSSMATGGAEEAGGAGVGMRTDRVRSETSYIIFVFIFFLGIEIGIGNPDTKTESNIIEYRYGANTNRNEYGNE
jgi:hypothetical protein